MEIYIKPVGPIGTNCYIISEEGGGCAMVDPGAQPEKLIGFLDAKGLKPEYILLTHGHYDHIGGVKAIAQKYAGRRAAHRPEQKPRVRAVPGRGGPLSDGG